MNKIRIYIADDHAVLRSGLRLLMQSQPDMEVVGDAGNFSDVLSELPSLLPDIVTLDLSMPEGLGLKAIAKIKKVSPGSRVVVLTMHDDPAYLRTALSMGVSGYVVKSAADTELLSAVRAVSQGRVFVDAQSSIENGARYSAIKDSHSNSGLEKLSSREREVLCLIARGHTNQNVATQLDVSVKTIESYRSRLMEKLGLKNRADLTRFAIEHGLLDPGSNDVLL